jgi:hypothetical protein
MIRILAALVAITAFAPVSYAADETLARGVPGSYTRAVTGMHSETLTLKRDGTYLFRFQFDISSDEEGGTWTVRDATVLLAPKQRGELTRNCPLKFRIVSVDGDLALSAIESDTEALPEEDVQRLFRPEKKRRTSLHSQLPGANAPLRG